ncbi:MAG: endonuclease/exonuclease/phosphatase family protein, partial [Gammaproteobacteria bacterium]|nr:endonuclease/exonuclease/phosphatase family protein [Gammaproteobacteria bacterium]
MTSKLDSDIRPLLHAYNFAGLALQETKLSSAVKQSELSVPNYRLFRRDRPKNGRSGGGVAVFARDEFKPRKVNFKSAPNLEFIAVELTSKKKKKFIVCSVYKPPKINNNDFIGDLTDVLAELQATCLDIVLLGDFNIDGLSPDSDAVNVSMAPLNFRQLIQEPTHLGRCLDHIYLSRDAVDCFSAGIGPPVEKNHALTWVQLRFSADRGPKESGV